MKRIWFTLIATVALSASATAATIAQWNFNSVPPDSTSNTGTNVPSVGIGTLGVVGTVIPNVSASQQYSSGNNSSDPATSDDSAFHTRNYPAQNEGNKTSGIEVRVSTVGFESIVVSWDQQNSATANRYTRFQYSLDGSTFIDWDVLTMTTSAAFVNGRSVNLTPIIGANGNPNFAFRLVSEFESTAMSSGTGGYVASGAGTYSTNGTIRFDMVTVSGSLPDGNSFPTITSIPNQTVRVDTATDPLPFTVGDVETPADQLTVNGISSNPAVLSDAAIIIEGAGANRTVTVQPNFDAIGQATVTLWVIDGGGKSNSTSFVLTVIPNNTAPSLAAITNVHTILSTPFAPIDITVADSEDTPELLSVSMTSSDQRVIPDENMVLGGTGANRTLTITPAPDQVGNAVITVTVTDSGYLTATRTFNAMVVPSSGIILSEPFDYADGSVVVNSARLWTTRAGVPNQMQIAGGTALVTGSQTEDIIARLIGGPYATGGSTVLYASFEVAFIGMPGVLPDIFAHFSAVDAGNLQGRVLVATTNVTPGYFRLGVGNTTSGSGNIFYPTDLSLDTRYQVVVSYDLATGSSQLWVDPASGHGPVTANDARQPMAINSFGLRQSDRVGDIRIDNLLVGLSFEAVTPNLTRVHIRQAGNSIQVYWPSGGIWSGWILEGTPTLENADWQQVTEPVVPTDGWDIVTIENPSENRFFRLKNTF
ncbi:MAG TPA: hypothetical protein VJ063_18675 [Verrucomicrobiae bacterium]|nr:hypothetical protein [Verrucomicrobiae bacterium]